MIHFIFISKDERLLSLTGSEPSLPINNSLISNGEKGVISKVKIKNNTKHSDLMTYVKSELKDFYSAYNGVILFCDSDYYSYLCKHFGLFFMVFDLSRCSTNITDGKLKQEIESLISLSVKKFMQIKKELLIKNGVLMRLPYRNFVNPRLRSFFDSLKRIHEIDISNLAADIKEIKNDCYKKIPDINPGRIFVDTNLNNFIFGHEYHSKQGTSPANGHNLLCDLSSKYRFSHRIDEFRHFNVQKRGKKPISGSFFNCHDARENINKVTHINMFTSDFMEY
ncbi:TPA: hypothetical protein SHY07_003616 [Escherichia coli]|uniref:hypothetical protein n=1 Tax=Escherichia albertii TaxID=208962 RepID=UPI0017FF84D0|nr:hypothetical protein [Escherichia albertii]EFA4859885.1 hypothetical protein [Escherichia coli]EFA4943352.1 hypothetical protein [Escherichia coli]EFA5471441.1 hypothetical protein [Escherichia coli]EFA5495714.1 hypothetical protein [Escherichia coli]EFA5504654.1 hypothetical protein [Escherichia coli]